MENKDLRRRDRIIPNRRIFPRKFPWTGFKQARSGRSKPGICTHPRVKSHGASATYTSLFAGKIKITPRFRRASPANATQRMARSRHLAWIKDAHRTRFRLKFASYAYTPPPKECDVKSDTRLCPAYSLIARRRIVAMLERFQWRMFKRHGKNGAPAVRSWKSAVKKWLRERKVFWILTWKILLKIPIVLKYNFRRIREHALSPYTIPLFLRVTRWWRVNVTSEKLEMSRVTARNAKRARSEFYSRWGGAKSTFALVRAVLPFALRNGEHYALRCEKEILLKTHRDP